MINVNIGIRREDKNKWERRAPFIPEDVNSLINEQGFEFTIQPSSIRIFGDDEYYRVGGNVSEDLQPCQFIFAIKEVPKDLILPGKVYIFFSHTAKGQLHNMPMLRAIMDRKCTLVDYEFIVDSDGRRSIYFGNYAGMAGIIDSMWALGQRLSYEGFLTPFNEVKLTYMYDGLKNAKSDIKSIGERISIEGIPEPLQPMVFGFAGYGNVSKGAQEIFDLFPHREVSARDVISSSDLFNNRHIMYKVVFKEEDMVIPHDPGCDFDLIEYYNFPDRYKSRFGEYLPLLTVLINSIYWDPRYPRLVTRQCLEDLYAGFPGQSSTRLRVIGDITCDINGAIECTIKCTDPDNPVYVYDVQEGSVIDGIEGRGPVIMAVDHLPCELPRESSTFFSNSLRPYVSKLVTVDYSRSFEEIELDPAIKNAIIVHQGELTPRFQYLKKYLNSS